MKGSLWVIRGLGLLISGLKGSLRAVAVFGNVGDYAFPAEVLERPWSYLSPLGLVFSVYFEVPPEVAATRAVARVAGGTEV